MPAAPIPTLVLSEHARFEMARRGLSEEVVAHVLAAPGQRFADRPGRDVLQSLVNFGQPPRPYVVRVFVDIERIPAEW